ncbi:MAG: DUF2000 domain-containing protein [Nocardioidaceae bacterium]|nr:DUF2000 domain-containing protein [Nocardioidaceae bacterium]
MKFDTKIAVVLAEGLLPWQELNVTAFLASGVTAAHPGAIGEPYADADGQTYLPLLGQPVVVLSAAAEVLGQVRERAVRRELALAVYTREMFGTGHDEANREVVAAVAGADLDLVGVALLGPRNAVDKTVKGAAMHP